MDTLFKAFDAVEKKAEEFRADMGPTIEKFNNLVTFLSRVREVVMEFDDFRM